MWLQSLPTDIQNCIFEYLDCTDFYLLGWTCHQWFDYKWKVMRYYNNFEVNETDHNVSKYLPQTGQLRILELAELTMNFALLRESISVNPHLHTLKLLSFSIITGDFMPDSEWTFENWPHLRCLVFNDSNASGPGIMASILKSCPNLTRLEIVHTRKHPLDMEAICSCSSLQYLELSQAQFDPDLATISMLSNRFTSSTPILPHLITLKLGSWEMLNSSLLGLLAPQLTNFQCRIDGHQVGIYQNVFKSFRSIESLEIGGVVSTEILEFIPHACRDAIKYLCIGRIDDPSNFFEWIQTLPALRVLRSMDIRLLTDLNRLPSNARLIIDERRHHVM